MAVIECVRKESTKAIINIDKLKNIIDLLIPTNFAKGVIKNRINIVINKFKKL